MWVARVLGPWLALGLAGCSFFFGPRDVGDAGRPPVDAAGARDGGARDAGDRDASGLDVDPKDVADMIVDAQSLDTGVFDVDVPDVHIPDVDVPDVDPPDVDIPDVPLPDVDAPDVDPPFACELVFPFHPVCGTAPDACEVVANSDDNEDCTSLCAAAGMFCAQGEWDPNDCPSFPETLTGCLTPWENGTLTVGSPNWQLTCTCTVAPQPPIDTCPPHPDGQVTDCENRPDGCGYGAVGSKTCDNVCDAVGLPCLTAYAANTPGCDPELEPGAEHNCNVSQSDHYCLCGPP